MIGISSERKKHILGHRGKCGGIVETLKTRIGNFLRKKTEPNRVSVQRATTIARKYIIKANGFTMYQTARVHFIDALFSVPDGSPVWIIRFGVRPDFFRPFAYEISISATSGKITGTTHSEFGKHS